MSRTHRFLFISLLAGILCLSGAASAQNITSDSRIKTFVYNANEVFSITTHYGYQSNVEFGPKESIETISVGDRVAWQIIPAGRRLFIRAMEENARTNMTVITNQRAYQFELRSSSAGAVFGSEALTYVVRFYYPSEANAGMIAPPPAPLAITPAAPAPMPVAAPAAIQQPPSPAPVSVATPAPAPIAALPVQPRPVSVATPAPAPIAALPVQPRPVATAAPMPPAPTPLSPVGTFPSPSSMNYRYTLTGPDDIAPTKIYDDGKTTYFKLPSTRNVPKFSIITSAGAAIDVPTRRTSDGLVAVDVVAQTFRLKQVGKEVLVYNEAGGEVN